MKSPSTPPKARSSTTSSKSSTSRGSGRETREGAVPTETPVQFVKGVGPRLGAVFKSRGIETVRDLLTFFPRSYEDRSSIKTVVEMQEGLLASVVVEVIGSRLIPLRTGKKMLEVRTQDSTGPLALKWFHVPKGMAERFRPGLKITVTGTPKKYMGRSEILHPEILWRETSIGLPATASLAAPTVLPTADTPDTGRITPVYVEIDGVPTRSLRKVLWTAVEQYAHLLPEDLPEYLLTRHSLPKLSTAVKAIHFPEVSTGSDAEKKIAELLEFKTPAHARLIYDEFLKFEYLILKQRMRVEKAPATPVARELALEAIDSLKKALPFSLTGGQARALEEILADITQPHPMNRLIQGDVGSGKTAVAFLSAAAVLAAGGQATLMAPTEILAEQHFKTAIKLFGGRLNCALLTGRSTQKERTALAARLIGGEPILLIGTHALIEPVVEFKNLQLILIDEQHRFGVEQRRALRNKGLRETSDGKTLHPHTLVLTATPIPRTLALTAFGDLSVSTIKERPPGRTPVITKVVRDQGRAAALDKIRAELTAGRQAYFIFPLVNESEAEGFTELKAATEEAERLQKSVFPEFKVGLLHGQQKADEKAQVMEAFNRGEFNILVSTTVVEVGVDVPNSTIMVVEHAERFGLSQLHQLRGRVGRGKHQSYCYFLSHPRVGEITAERLEVLERTEDGFEIAEADLEIRGPGEFMGTRQAGTLPFRLASLVRDQKWLIAARDDVLEILKADPELERPEHTRLKAYFEREGRTQSDRLKTS